MTGPAAGSGLPPEPVTPTTPRPVRRPLLVQDWTDLAFLHWEIPVAAAGALLPPRVRPDTHEGRTYVGLVPLRMRTRLGPGVPLGPPGRLLEVNVRLYSVDDHGRRGVVFRSLDADRLAIVLAARAMYRLPYQWARLAFAPESAPAGSVPTHRSYRIRRRGGPASRMTLQVAPEPAAATPLEHFLTDRWGQHVTVRGRTQYLPIEHQPWVLHRAELVELADGLVAAAGLPRTTERAPVSVLWAPGVTARLGRALRPALPRVDSR